jgi:peptidoglycan/LPS O-acetylase OafA/YrhL
MSDRLHEVDGIRGWAALVVLLYHTFGEMLKYAVPEINSPWLAPFLSSDIAVLMFFILSGDALSSGFFAGQGDRFIDRLMVRRYFRLTVPIFFSCFVTYIVLRMDLNYHAEAAIILHREDWLGNFLRFHESFVSLLHYSLTGVYVSHSAEKSYNPFLWTMSVEMVGSILVFLLCYTWERLRNPPMICIVLSVFLTCFGSFLGLFFAGAYIGYLRKIGFLNRLLHKKNYQYFCLLVVIAIVAMLIFFAYAELPASFLPVRMGLALMLVFCFYTHPGLKNFFSNRFSQFLGDISFPLYLIHFQILISLMSWLVVRDYSDTGTVIQSHMVVIGSVAVGASMSAAWLTRRLEKQVLKKIDFYALKVLVAS